MTILLTAFFIQAFKKKLKHRCRLLRVNADTFIISALSDVCPPDLKKAGSRWEIFQAWIINPAGGLA